LAVQVALPSLFGPDRAILNSSLTSFSSSSSGIDPSSRARARIASLSRFRFFPSYSRARARSFSVCFSVQAGRLASCPSAAEATTMQRRNASRDRAVRCMRVF
jgi:hypothetical protein